MDVEELAAAVRQNIARLRRDLAQEEEFLAQLEARTRTTSATARDLAPQPARLEPAPATPRIATSASLTVRRGRSEKRDMVRTLVTERPGRWSTRQIRDALTERGVDPEAGTPVKNILWQLAKEGFGKPLGGGEYEFPAPSVNGDAGHEREESSL
jgi:hypothetical protein